MSFGYKLFYISLILILLSSVVFSQEATSTLIPEETSTSTLTEETTRSTITLTPSASPSVTSTSFSVSPTFVWATGYDENGDIQTTESPYTQKFEKFWSTVHTPPTGSIGLGSITGTVGTIRVYPTLTVSSDKKK